MVTDNQSGALHGDAGDLGVVPPVLHTLTVIHYALIMPQLPSLTFWKLHLEVHTWNYLCSQ